MKTRHQLELPPQLPTICPSSRPRYLIGTLFSEDGETKFTCIGYKKLRCAIAALALRRSITLNLEPSPAEVLIPNTVNMEDARHFLGDLKDKYLHTVEQAM